MAIEGKLIAKNMLPLHFKYKSETYSSPFYDKKEQSALMLKAFRNLEYQNLLISNHRLIGATIMEGEQLQNTFNQIIGLLEKEIIQRKK